MEFGYLADDAQAQAATPRPAGFVGPIKAIKESRQVCRRDPRPVVFHGQLHAVEGVAGRDGQVTHAGGVGSGVID